MARWKIYTPEGVSDILFEDAFRKRNLEASVRGLFRHCGYREIETPSVEYFDAFYATESRMPQEGMFKFFDARGRILVLRPDATIPVARVVATKLKDTPLPVKAFYIGNCFRYNEAGGGKQREYTEAGLEILGAEGPEADAEAVAASIRALQTCGLENFQIDIGQVEFFKGLMEQTGFSDEAAEQIRALIDSKDELGLEEFINRQGVQEPMRHILLELPGMFGSVEVIDSLQGVELNQRSARALENLREVLAILEDYGCSKYVSVDLGMVPSLHYYTGVIFRGFTHGIGFPLVSGGRYDSLLNDFGRDCPATGFSLGINLLMMALERQKIPGAAPETDTLIAYACGGRKFAFRLAEHFRTQGMVVETDIAGQTPDALRKYCSCRGIGGFLYVTGDGTVEVHHTESGDVQQTRIEAMLNS